MIEKVEVVVVWTLEWSDSFAGVVVTKPNGDRLGIYSGPRGNAPGPAPGVVLVATKRMWDKFSQLGENEFLDSANEVCKMSCDEKGRLTVHHLKGDVGITYRHEELKSLSLQCTEPASWPWPRALAYFERGEE